MSGTLKVGGKTIATHNTNTNVSKLIADEVNLGSDGLVVDISGNVGIGTSSPSAKLETVVSDDTTTSGLRTNQLSLTNSFSATGSTGASANLYFSIVNGNTFHQAGISAIDTGGNSTFATDMAFFTRPSVGGAPAERMRIDSSGNVLVGKTNSSLSNAGAVFNPVGLVYFTRASGSLGGFNRTGNDGVIVSFYQDGTVEGDISVSGTTVSYNGGHLSRWSQLADNTRDESIVKGTVMSNLDQMAEWTNDGVTEDNEQLNCMKVSDVEGDRDVAGVFVNWDNDDDIYVNDMNIAMTGDMVIRIAQGTTVQRGDLLMSAGDGTAKPQGDDIVRSKTIAKVTSTYVSHTYEDGSYLVPCVLMAC